MSTGAVVLAAGGGTRFAGPVHKLLVPFRGRPLVAWALEAACRAGVDEVAVVSGAVDLGAVVPSEVTVLVNADWAQGQASSLQTAVAWAELRGHDALVVGLGDQPLVPAGAWRAVADAGGPLSVASFDGQKRPPVCLGRSVWPLLPRHGDEGARVVMAARPDLVRPVVCEGEPIDIDSEEDLTRWS